MLFLKRHSAWLHYPSWLLTVYMDIDWHLVVKINNKIWTQWVSPSSLALHVEPQVDWGRHLCLTKTAVAAWYLNTPPDNRALSTCWTQQCPSLLFILIFRWTPQVRLYLNSPRGSLLGIPLLLLLKPNLISRPCVLSLAALLTDLLCPADQEGPPAGSIGFVPGLDPNSDEAAEVMACEAMMSISSRSSWVKYSSSPNGSSRGFAIATSWLRPRRRLVGGAFIL